MSARALCLSLVPALAASVASAQTSFKYTYLEAKGPETRQDKEASRVQDVVFFGTAQPVFIRLRLERDGTGFETVWRDGIRRLHKYMDTDQDNRLSADERRRGSWLQQLVVRSSFVEPRGNPAGVAAPAPSSVAMDHVVTVDDLTDYLRNSFGPLQLQIARPSSTGPELLFTVLDRDGDKALTKAELEGAASSLRRLDRDDDETLQVQEVQSYRNPYFGRAAATAPAFNGENDPLALLSSNESRTKLVRRLLSQYDRDGEKDRKLSRSEIGMEPSSFEQADGDGDGGLDSDELLHYLRDARPDLEFSVQINRSAQPRVTLVGAEAGPTGSSRHTRSNPSGGLDLILGTDELELGAPSRANQIVARQFFENQFRVADVDNNKYLDLKEAQRGRIFTSQTFALMDRDGDGKLFEKEMADFLTLEAEIAQSRTLLTVIDQGRSLFDVLDTDHDRRLSVREIRSVITRVTSWDRNGDGLVTDEEIPHHYQLSFASSPSTLLSGLGFAVASVENVRMYTGTVVTSSSRPAWFTKMDRNHDGDLSRREFLGSLADFNRLDADHNGLLDPSEAGKAR